MELSVKLLQDAEKNTPPNARHPKAFLAKASVARAPELDPPGQLNKRRTMISVTAQEDPEIAWERYMGDNDLLPVNYLQLGALKAAAVGRLRYFDRQVNKPGLATGFLVSPDLIMTNCHVFPAANSFQDALIEFDYCYDISGNEKQKKIFQLNAAKFFYAHEAMDFCLIGIEPNDQSGRMPISSRGYLVMNPTTGKAGNGDFAAIIQHPEGQPQQVAIRENRILDVVSNPDFLYYDADTAQGSSGAAVFNDQWQLIALHSAGNAKKDASGQYVDRDDKPIPVDPRTGKIDSALIVWENNRGARVSAIWRTIHGDPTIAAHPLILSLKAATYSDERSYQSLSLPTPDPEKLNPPAAGSQSSQVPHQAQQPTQFPSQSPPRFQGQTQNQYQPPPNSPNQIHIHLHIGDGGAISLPATTTIEQEKKIEDTIDFSTCQGFDTFFMEAETPLPKLSTQLRAKVAKLLDNPNVYVLKYHHYSTVQHAIRQMPVYSAINIYGKRRYTELEGRSDNWYRDRRIDFDVQLDDDFYYYSKMDKGHMARREDAEWGYSIGFAKTAADMTCSYTNACPQVPTLNRSRYGYHGEWGQLEEEFLEKGVEGEQGAEAKICVYNGPIFNADDPFFKSIQIPLSFFKIVVWRNPAKELKTTGFILSQADLVGDVDFEALRFDEIFTHRQVAIEVIEDLTGLTFEKIRDWDTNG